MIIGFYGCEITISDELFNDLETKKTDIVGLPYDKYELFRGDMIRFSPESNPNVYSDYEIIGHAPVADENGKYVTMLNHVEKINHNNFVVVD